MFRKSWFTVLLVMLLVLGGVGWKLVVVEPFPFVDVAYVRDRTIFNSEDMGTERPEYALAISGITEEQVERIRSLTRRHENAEDKGTLGTVRLFVRTTRAIMESAEGRETRTLGEITEKSSRFKKICSEYAKVLCVIAQSHDVMARVIWMNHHTTAELFFPREGWVHVDAYGNIAFADDAGNLISVLAYRAGGDKGTVIKLDDTVYVRPQPDYSASFEKIRHVYVDNDLYLVLSGKSLFSYPAHHRNPLDIFLSMLDFRDLGYGIQYVGTESELPGVGNVGLDAYRRLNL